MKLVHRKATGGSSLKEGSNPSLLERVLSMRGVNSSGELLLQLKNLHPISKLKSIEQATTLLVDTIINKQRILIIGDFDADGATSTALSVRALNMMGHQKVDYLVPNRFEFGYGLTPEIVLEAKKFSPDLIMTVDNGISSIKGVEQAKSMGYKVIITDHHLPAKQLPKADAIINPNQVGCEFPSKNLAGVGVAFYLMLALKSALLKKQYFTKNNLVEPNLTELLDLVALGTVADVVPLDENNRILVEQGLRRMRSGLASAGINALFTVGKRNINNAVSTDLGFTCGPRLNAAGRLDDMSLGIECLLSNDPQQAMDYATALDDLNIERRAIEESMKAEALTLLEELDKDQFKGELPSVICLYKSTWHQGVIGILAARVRERYNRPTIIFAQADPDDDSNTDIKGSARSIPTIHIRDVFDEVATANEGLLEKFGGHAMAAGLTLDKSSLETFTQAICQVVESHADEETFQEVFYSDGQLKEEDFDLKNADSLRYAAPWGQHFPPPVFDNQFVVLNKKLLKEKHLKLLLRPCGDLQKPLQIQRTVQAIAFNIDLKDWPEEGSEVHLLYKLEVNEFRGNCCLQLMIEKILS
jgi:single-stranded-DNA-specific exonuclease